jgi:hypothetical protein
LHTHGGGKASENPWDPLYSRVPHCGTSIAEQYILQENRRRPGGQQLRDRFDVVMDSYRKYIRLLLAEADRQIRGDHE